MMFLWLIIIGAIVYFVITGQNQNGNVFSNFNTQSNPLEIAKSRLAKGEISLEEYENIKKNLQ